MKEYTYKPQVTEDFQKAILKAYPELTPARAYDLAETVSLLVQKEIPKHLPKKQ